jgi:chemotaxis protein CheD
MVRCSSDSIALPGFEHYRRHWDPVYQSQTVKILPGQYYVTKLDEVLVTTLGSCISVCIRDASVGIGGMNHFMLPSGSDQHDFTDSSHPWSVAARYGNFAMELLINAIIKNGGERKRLEVKVFGGAKILTHMKDIGCLNIDFIRNYLQAEALPVSAEDVGGRYPRKVLYFPTTGKARVKKLQQLGSAAIAKEEAHYRSDLNRNNLSGEVELFDEIDMD